MNCNFRERHISARDAKIIRKCANAGAISQIDQACKRSDAMTYIAALNIGIEPEQINELIAEKNRVFAESAEYREDGILDFGLQKHLDDHGINFKIGCDEI